MGICVCRVIHKLENYMPKPLRRMAKAYMEQNTPCGKKYNCPLFDSSEEETLSEKVLTKFN